MSYQQLHASAFAHQGAGCLLLGESGTGKSAAVAQALLLGAALIADDLVDVTNDAGGLIAAAPQALAGVLELCGLGLIRPESAIRHHPLHLVITLTKDAHERLPAPETYEILGVFLPHLRLSAAPHTPIASILLYLQAMRNGRILPQDWRP